MSNRISEDARKLILDDLIRIECCTGGQSVAEFVKRVFPDVENMTYIEGSRTKPILNEIARHMDSFDDWDFNYLFETVLELTKVPDNKFISFCEQYVHPIFRRTSCVGNQDEIIDLNEKCIEAINKGLFDVGLNLKPASQTAGRTIYKAVTIAQGTQYPIKNIIFAAKYKPDIVLDDALSNDIRIVNTNGALVYAQGIPAEGIRWKQIVDWYKIEFSEETENNLVMRFLGCLDSDAEKLFFKSYVLYLKEIGENIPALIPQVYMYYDPKTKSEREWNIFEHQKMDFMMILSPTQRIVIEIDGQQHYAEDQIASGTAYKHYASPTRYAEMMKAHREMSLSGYDVYRFGGKELWSGGSVSEEGIISNIKKFFTALFEKYHVQK